MQKHHHWGAFGRSFLHIRGGAVFEFLEAVSSLVLRTVCVWLQQLCQQHVCFGFQVFSPASLPLPGPASLVHYKGQPGQISRCYHMILLVVDRFGMHVQLPASSSASSTSFPNMFFPLGVVVSSSSFSQIKTGIFASSIWIKSFLFRSIRHTVDVAKTPWSALQALMISANIPGHLWSRRAEMFLMCHARTHHFFPNLLWKHLLQSSLWAWSE